MRLKTVVAACIVVICASSGPVFAQSVMKQCSEAYRAAKAANQLNGEAWPQFLSHCSAEKSAQTETPATSAPVNPPAAAAVASVGAAAAPPAAAAPSPASATATTPPVVAVAASRQKQCGAEWRANKAALKAQYGTWPKYWSTCNKRLKAEGK